MKNKFFIFIICFFSLFALADRYASLEIFTQVLNVIKIHYFKEVKLDILVHGAIKGLLREIDPYSQLLSSDDLKKFKTYTEGQFYGIGIEVEKKQGFLIVISVVKKSSSEKAGLRQGDKIIQVNNQIVKDLTLGEFSKIFKKKRSRYKITVLRSGVKKPLSFRLKSSKIKVQSISFKKIEGDFYYLRIYYFSQKTFSDVHKAIAKLKIKGLIIDVRDNPGGSLDQSIRIADLFLDKGVIVSYKTRHSSSDEVFKARFSNTLDSFPLVMLINEYSASASEVLAGALKDHKRATLVGQKSFGKGSIQTVFPIKKKYALKLTIGEYKTPLGYSIHHKGIKPHVLLSDSVLKNKKSIDSFLKDEAIQKSFKILKTLKN